MFLFREFCFFDDTQLESDVEISVEHFDQANERTRRIVHRRLGDRVSARESIRHVKMLMNQVGVLSSPSLSLWFRSPHGKR